MPQGPHDNRGSAYHPGPAQPGACLDSVWHTPVVLVFPIYVMHVYRRMNLSALLQMFVS